MFVISCAFSLDCSGLVHNTSASDQLERLASEMTFNELMGALNLTHSLTHDPNTAYIGRTIKVDPQKNFAIFKNNYI